MSRLSSGALACWIVFCVWALDRLADRHIPLWDHMGPAQRWCHVMGHLSGHPPQFGDGRCESLQ